MDYIYFCVRGLRKCIYQIPMTKILLLYSIITNVMISIISIYYYYCHSPLVSVVPLAHDVTTCNTDKKAGLFYRKWVGLLYHMLFPATIYHWYGIYLFLCQHGDSGLWVDGICCVTRDNMECVTVLSNDCLLAQE